MVAPAYRPPASARDLPMTAVALVSVRAEIESIESELATEASGAPGESLVIGRARLERRLESLREALGSARVEDDPGIAAVGRRVMILDDDDPEPETFSLVLPGDGDPGRGWVSVDAPLGAALAGQRAGDLVRVDAPAGPRMVRLLVVESSPIPGRE